MPKRAYVLALGFLLVGSVGCGSSRRQALEFNQALVQVNKRLAEPFRQFDADVQKALKSGKATPGLKGDHERLVQAVEGAGKELAELQTPALPGAAELRAAAEKFLRFARSAVNGECKTVVELLRRDAQSPLNRKTIQNLRAALDRQQREAAEALQAAQRAFAEANGITLR
jgi:hypothetical protein